MRIRVALVAFSLCAACFAWPASAEQWRTACNIAIPATMIDSVQSATAYPGMRFRFKTTHTVLWDRTIIPAGSIGYGYVRSVTAASNRDRNGSLILEERRIYVRNQPIEVMGDPREGSLWAPAATMTERASGYLPIPGVVRTAVNEVRDGRNVTIGPGFNFNVVPFSDVRYGQPCAKVIISG